MRETTRPALAVKETVPLAEKQCYFLIKLQEIMNFTGCKTPIWKTL